VSRPLRLPDGRGPHHQRLQGSGTLIIHTVGPVWSGGDNGEDDLLRNCYRNCFALAELHGIKTIAFPAISAGVYGFPMERACRIALREMISYLEKKNVDVIAVCFSERALGCYQVALQEF
jgi:O-acetyl-ADP-ribose deacetylase (regulator of RNase III)